MRVCVSSFKAGGRDGTGQDERSCSSVRWRSWAHSARRRNRKSSGSPAYGGSFEQTMRKEDHPVLRGPSTASRSSTSPATPPTRSPSCRRRRATSRSTWRSSTTARCTRPCLLGFCASIQGLAAGRSFTSTAPSSRTTRVVGIGLVGTGIMIQHQGLQGEGLGGADLLERPQGPEVQEAAGDPADQQHHGLQHPRHLRAHERRRREVDRARLQGHEGPRIPQRARLRAVAGQDDRAVPERARR